LPEAPRQGAELVRAVRAALAALADPAKAPAMQAYMKSSMPYLGVQSSERKRALRELFAAHPLDGFDAWQATVRTLWHEATYREERYAAVALTLDRAYRGLRTPAALPLFEELIVQGAWWDYGDAVAVDGLGDLLAREPVALTPVVLDWSRSDDLWKRRSAIIAQIKRKTATDLDLLYACIEPNLAERDFFIRKAIGWALRAYAWTDPAEVVRYVREHDSRLSGLSRREALKNVG
jgi:3-methyladenine DNA glycosylase AlkD